MQNYLLETHYVDKQILKVRQDLIVELKNFSSEVEKFIELKNQTNIINQKDEYSRKIKELEKELENKIMEKLDEKINYVVGNITEKINLKSNEIINSAISQINQQVDKKLQTLTQHLNKQTDEKINKLTKTFDQKIKLNDEIVKTREGNIIKNFATDFHNECVKLQGQSLLSSIQAQNLIYMNSLNDLNSLNSTFENPEPKLENTDSHNISVYEDTENLIDQSSLKYTGKIFIPKNKN